MQELSSFRFTKITKRPKDSFFHIHQHSTYELVFIVGGSLELTLDFQNFTLKENSVYLIKPGQIHQWSKNTYPLSCQGYIFHFSKEFFPSSKMVNELFDNNTIPIIEISNETKEDILNLSLMIEKEKDEALKAYLLGSILLFVLKFKTSNTNLYYKDKRIYKLLDLIEENFIDEKSAQFYASHFELTTKRLNELCKQYLNETLSSLIIQRNIAEIKRELSFGNLSMIEISDKLKFSDASHFSKFFKKYTSYTPLEFKQLKS